MLLEQNIQLEDFGGDVQSVCISALKVVNFYICFCLYTPLHSHWMKIRRLLPKEIITVIGNILLPKDNLCMDSQDL